jgi:hypothetical protein
MKQTTCHAIQIETSLFLGCFIRDKLENRTLVGKSNSCPKREPYLADCSVSGNLTPGICSEVPQQG